MYSYFILFILFLLYLYFICMSMCIIFFFFLFLSGDFQPLPLITYFIHIMIITSMILLIHVHTNTISFLQGAFQPLPLKSYVYLILSYLSDFDFMFIFVVFHVCLLQFGLLYFGLYFYISFLVILCYHFQFLLLFVRFSSFGRLRASASR